MSSNAVKGGAWNYTLYHTRNADIPGASPIKVWHKDLKDFFAKELAGDDPILQVWIYKHNLFSWLVPKWFGLWHEFTVVDSLHSGIWSFEKCSDGIHVQRSNNSGAVIKFYRGKVRQGWIEDEGRASQIVTGYGDKVQDIFNWIYYWDYLNEKYDVIESNCQNFASELFEAIACQKGRKLRRN